MADELECLRARVEELEQKNRELATEANYWRDLTQGFPGFVVLIDQERRFLWTNRIHPDLTADQVIGQRIDNFNSPESLPSAIEAIESVFETGECGSYVATFDLPTGETLWYLNDVLPVTSSAEPLVIVVTSDLTKVKRAEKTYEEGAEQHRAYIKGAPLGIFVLDSWGHYLEVNSAAARLTGYSQEQLLQMSIVDSVSPESQSEALSSFEKVKEMGHSTSESTFRKPDGSEVLVRIDSVRVREDRFLAFCTDITEKRELEEKLNHSQRLESVGRLAGGLAHDFNNLLTVIAGSCDLIASEVPESLREDVEAIQSASQQAELLTQQLLAFSRRQVLKPESLILCSVIEDTLTILERLLGEDIQLSFQPQGCPAWIMVDRTQIEQVLMNLAVNARDAMPQGGKLELEVKNDGELAVLTVRDNGCGMEEQELSKIFDPFYTTKGPGKGTGLGLSTVHGIVTQSGGEVSVKSSLGQGTCFTITLPITEAGETQAKDSLPDGWKRGSERILVVEDDKAVRRFVRTVLERAGYQVQVAADGEEALAMYESGLRVNLLLTDVVMPGVNGPQVAAVFEQDSQTRILFMSGYTDDEAFRRGVKEAEVSLLQKPFTVQELTGRIRSLLDSAHS